MNKRTVLELLKPKAKMLGFSRKELGSVAEAIMSALPEDIDEADEESTINQKIDEYLPLLRVGQSAASRQAAASTRSSIIDDDPDDDDDSDDDDFEVRRPKPKGKRNGNHDDDFADAPRWARRLARLFQQGSDSNIRRRAKVEALVENMGNMGKHLLRDFDRHSFRNDDEFEEYFADLKDEVSEYIQDERGKGLDSLSRPVGAVPGRMSYRKDDEMSDEEVIALAKGE